MENNIKLGPYKISTENKGLCSLGENKELVYLTYYNNKFTNKYVYVSENCGDCNNEDNIKYILSVKRDNKDNEDNEGEDEYTADNIINETDSPTRLNFVEWGEKMEETIKTLNKLIVERKKLDDLKKTKK